MRAGVEDLGITMVPAARCQARMICAGVALSRYLLGFGRIWLQELYVVCFAVSFMLIAAYAYQTDAHIRIEVLHQRWSPRARAWVEIAGCVLFLVPWLALVFWSSLPFVRLSWLVREPSAQPGGIANTAEPIGVVHWFSRSSVSSRCWIGRNWPRRSAWKDTKICPASEIAPESGGGAMS